MENYNTNTYGDIIADIYDQIHKELDTSSVVKLLLSFKAKRVLELGVGTGRIAIPLIQSGLEVYGIESSSKMIETLKNKQYGDKISIIFGDMTTSSINKDFPLIFCIFNTIFCLTKQQKQIECFRNVARHLSKDGIFILECAVPDMGGFAGNQNISVSSISTNDVIISTKIHNAASQEVLIQYIVIENSNKIRLIPIKTRYAWPSELDTMAYIAGLKLKHRWGNWQQNTFTASSSYHVSVYEKC